MWRCSQSAKWPGLGEECVFVSKVVSHFLSSVPCAHYSVSCKQIISHRSVTQEIYKWAEAAWWYTWSLCAHTLRGAPPVASLRDVYLKTAHAVNRLHPFFPLPRHLIQEKTVSEDIFHTLSVIFLAALGCVGRDPSVISSQGSFSCCQLPQQRPDGPLWGLLRRRTRQPRRLITVWPAILTANITEL